MSESLTPLPSTIPPASIVDAYLRDSGGELQDRSVSRQLESIKAYCLKYNLKLRHIYQDAAKSGGTTAGRDAFDLMISSTRDEANRPTAILLWNYARFARDLDDSTYYKALLRSKRNIIIHSLTDHIPEGPYGRFVEILIDISNEEKRRQTSIDAADGIRSIVAQGAIPGTPPRGFMRQPIITINPRTGLERKNHRWVPDPKFIHRIRKAFQMRADGSSLNDIQQACKLYTTINSYSTFWRNPIYYGTLIYAGITLENYCKPIIQKSLWDKVQLIQQGFAQSKNVKSGNRLHPRRQASNYILSGFAHCARCGSPLYGSTSARKNSDKKNQSYLCTLAYRKRGECTKGRIPKEAFEKAVIEKLGEEIYTEGFILEMMRVQTERQAGLASEQQDQRRELLARIAANKKKIYNLTEAIAESGSSPSLLTRLNDLEHEQQELHLDLSALSEVEAPLSLTSAQLKPILQHIAATLHSKDPAEIKALLPGILAYVDVERNDNLLAITVYCYFPEDNNNNPPPGDDMPTPRHPPGSHSRRHTMQFKFTAPTKRPR